MLDLLDKMATSPGAKAKKESKPEVNDPALDKIIDSIIDAKNKVAHYEAIQSTSEAQARASLLPALRQVCRRDRKVQSSMRVNGKLTLTSQNRYSKVPGEHKAALREVFADDFDRYFKDELKIELTPEAAADEAFLGTLIKSVGEAEFMRRFKVARTLSVTETFHTAVTLDEKVEAAAAPFVGSEIIKQATPSFRV